MIATSKFDMARLFLNLRFDIAIMRGMTSKFHPGSKVSVTEFGGKSLIRRVVADCGRTVIVCNETEYIEATQEKRKPNGIGFPRYNVTICGKPA